MLLSFRCPPPLKERIDALVRAGLYPDFSSFVVAALENQLLQEETFAEEATGPRVVSPSLPAVSTGLELSRLGGSPPCPLPGAVPEDLSSEQPITVDHWIFGQYNRLLPAKVSLRALAVMTAESGDAVPLAEAAPRIAELAARFGSRLRDLDRRLGTHRDEALATAFPDEGPEGQKGRLRYENHFVGHTVNGRPGGLPADLRLAAILMRKNRPWVTPTTAGWEFARLPNPLLDGSAAAAPPHRFSDEEADFLLRHIRQAVPAEAFACRVVLSLIAGGDRTPELLTRGLAAYLPPGKNPNKLKDFLSTQRTGVLGRASDLGLIRRVRQARHISYRLTDRGQAFLGRLGGPPEA
jgi:Arc/MetJ-type ribon-helix-helix transcriptional regulator